MQGVITRIDTKEDSMNSITFPVIADADSSTVELDHRLRIFRI